MPPALTAAARAARLKEQKAAARKRYKAKVRDEGRALNRSSEKRRKMNKRLMRPFVGCDGEGAGVDDLGRQNYLLFRMGDRELYRDGQRLETEEILDFICDAPRDAILVGFAFGYDVTMILRDLPVAQQKRLFEPKVFGEGKSPYVWYKSFDIDYLPRNYLKVRRVNVVRDPETGQTKRIPVKGSQRIIYEAFGFFQMSFLKALYAFDVGTEEQRQSIADNKARRSEFTGIDQEEREYCAMECEFLAELMTRLRQYCYEADIVPRTWSGAGKLAKALLAKHKDLTADEVRAIVPPEVMNFANMAYYGGRFEITRVGMINQSVYEYDIRSAYPAAQVQMPCLVHGSWKALDPKKIKEGDLYVASCIFAKIPDANEYGELGALPIRTKQGHLHWPLRGGGVYWSCEIESAKLRGFKVTLKEGWHYETKCDCSPYAWLGDLFDYRMKIGSKGPGYPIKLGINSCYGAKAQRVGNGKYNNMIYAGLITAITRSTLNNAIALAPHDIIMVATDAVYSLTPLDLPEGKKLGDWESEELDGLFIVQPGLYWSPSKRKKKSRGLSGRFFEEAGRTEAFEEKFKIWQAAENSALEIEFPKVSVPVPGFIGLKLAISRGKPEIAGTWVNDTRDISFDYRNKRTSHKWFDGHLVTKPKLGSIRELSLPHRDFLAGGGAEPWEEARAMLWEQPDYVDLGIPFKD